MGKGSLGVFRLYCLIVVTFGRVVQNENGYYSAIDANTANKDEEICTTKACTVAAGGILSKLDEEADPCQDMVQFACGKWFEDNEIPPSENRWGVFGELEAKISSTLHAVMESDEPDAQSVQYMRDMYKGCMNEAAIEMAGYEWFLTNVVNNGNGGWPLAIGSDNFVEADFDMAEVAGMCKRQYGQYVAISGDVHEDIKDVTQSVIYIDQPSLVLSRQMYVENTDGKYDEYIAAYKELTIDVAQLMAVANGGDGPSIDELEAFWSNLFAIETKIAEMSSPAEDRRNATAMYNPYSLLEIREMYPNVHFAKFFEQLFDDTDIGKLPDDQRIIVREPKFFQQLDTALAENELFTKEGLANYMFLRIAISLASQGPKELEQINFKFESKISGASYQPPRWQTCVGLVSSDDRGFGMAAGHAYVREKFDDESRQVASDLIEDIRLSFKELVSESEWMDVETQALAQEKADAVYKEVAYPDWLPDNDELDKYFKEVTPPFADRNVINVASMTAWSVQSGLNKLNEPATRDSWVMQPATVNAWYLPEHNSITFPAGILQSPFFDKGYPKYLNYGSIGVVMGHELTHGFDDEGRQYDKIGNVSPWWSEETIAAFDERAQCFVDMYQNYTVPELIPILGDDAHLNGVNTLGENIADNGGVRESFRAYQNYITNQNGGKPEPKLPGLQEYTSEQLFFISFSQTWCEKMTIEKLLDQVLSNPHSPGKYRIIGPCSNSDEFVKAYNCPVGSNMNRKDKCILW